MKRLPCHHQESINFSLIQLPEDIILTILSYLKIQDIIEDICRVSLTMLEYALSFIIDYYGFKEICYLNSYLARALFNRIKKEEFIFPRIVYYFCHTEDIDIWKFIIKRFNFISTNLLYPLVNASIKGNFALVKLLLTSDRIHDNDGDYSINDSIIGACLENHFSIVKLLLTCDRIDPSCNRNKPIIDSCENGYHKVVQELLKDPRVDPTINDNQCIMAAARYDYHKVMRLLLSDNRVDPNGNSNHIPIVAAAGNSCNKVIRVLLTDPRVCPNVACNKAIIEATYYDHIETMKILLADNRVDASARNNKAMRIALEYGNKEAAKLLFPICHKFIYEEQERK